jgi:hypothetical protein
MQKMNLKKVLLSLVVVVAVFGLVWYLARDRNQETIIDLGNGWRSYSHEKLGFTVKIPEDAEIEAGKFGDKNENFSATFSKGDIKEIRTMYCCGMGGFGDPNNIEDVHRYYDVHNDKDYNWKYSSSNKKRPYFSREIIIDNKVVTFDFSLIPFSEEGNRDDILRLIASSPDVLGKERRHVIDFRSIDTIIPKIAEDGTPRPKEEIEEDIEEFVNKKIELVKDLVISIDNF